MGVPVPDLLEISGLYDTGGAPVLPPSYRSNVPLSIRDIVVYTSRFRFARWHAENQIPDSGEVTDVEEGRPIFNGVPGQVAWLLERIRATGLTVFGLVFGPNWDGSPKRFGKEKGAPARFTRIGQSLKAYRIFRNEFRMEVPAIQSGHLWENLPESTRSEIQATWLQVNKTRAKMSVEECVQITTILPMTYLALGYVAEIRELLSSVEKKDVSPWTEVSSLVDVEYHRDPLAYWEELSARFGGGTKKPTSTKILKARGDHSKDELDRFRVRVNALRTTLEKVKLVEEDVIAGWSDKEKADIVGIGKSAYSKAKKKLALQNSAA